MANAYFLPITNIMNKLNIGSVFMNNLLVISSFSHHLICWRTSCTRNSIHPSYTHSSLLDPIFGIDNQNRCVAFEFFFFFKTYLFCRCHEFCLHNIESALYDLTIKVITSILMEHDMNLRFMHSRRASLPQIIFITFFSIFLLLWLS